MRDLAYTIYRRFSSDRTTVGITFPPCPRLSKTELEGLINRLIKIKEEMTIAPKSA